MRARAPLLLCSLSSSPQLQPLEFRRRQGVAQARQGDRRRDSKRLPRHRRRARSASQHQRAGVRPGSRAAGGRRRSDARRAQLEALRAALTDYPHHRFESAMAYPMMNQDEGIALLSRYPIVKLRARSRCSTPPPLMIVRVRSFKMHPLPLLAGPDSNQRIVLMADIVVGDELVVAIGNTHWTYDVVRRAAARCLDADRHRRAERTSGAGQRDDAGFARICGGEQERVSRCGVGRRRRRSCLTSIRQSCDRTSTPATS